MRTWSSSPRTVTVKLMRVVSAWISGGKCGFDNFVCKNNLHKRGTDGTVTEKGALQKELEN